MLDTLLIVLQAFHVLFLWLHDWLPLGRLNDISAIARADSLSRRIRITLIQSVPYTVGLIYTIRSMGRPFPHWLYLYLWISYGLLFLGELRAWWIPYLFRAEPERAARYQVLFGKTHSFLPVRNGIAPNTLHVILHFCTAATLLTLTAFAALSAISLQM